MKKLFLITGLLSFSITSFSQSQNWWKSDGTNTGSASTFVGTSNSFALKFKSNNIEWFSISPLGIYKFNSLNGTTNGILGVNSSGELFRTNLTGNANDVFRGDGTFGSISSLSGWFFAGNVIFSDGSKNIGIGTNIAPEKLSVNGNIVANGSISGTSLNVIDIVGAGKEFKILNSLCLKGIDANVPGSRNMICGLNGDLYVQSTNANYNTIINYGNVGKVGIGLIPTEDFHVGVKARFDNDVYTNKIFTNKITSTDSIISFGDSTIQFNWSGQNIYGDINQINVKGLGLGVSATGVGKWSTAIGYKVRSSGEGSVVIGSANSNGSTFWNTTPYSLAVGFNSNIPTLFVGSANGTGTFGNVGIGTSSPQDRFQIGNDYTSVSFGRADVGDLQFGTSYMGFNATRTSAGWIVKTDGAGNGGGVIYSTLHGKMFFSSIPNTGAMNKTLTDLDVFSNVNLVMHPGGGVSIGTDCLPGSDYGLAVKGKIITEEFTVDLTDANGCWPDFVFNNDYKRLAWREKNDFILKNGHLPYMLSGSKIESDGLNISSTMIGLTQNVEENTLDIIDIYKKLEELLLENERLKIEISSLKNNK